MKFNTLYKQKFFVLHTVLTVKLITNCISSLYCTINCECIFLYGGLFVNCIVYTVVYCYFYFLISKK